LVFRLYKF
jgi:hypothetical protein